MVDTDFTAGMFLVDKPEGPSSFAMVSHVRRLLGMKKVGHAGTLDPFASGLLIICAGRPATRLISQLMDGDKEYIATLRLGYETTTCDPEGDVVATCPVEGLNPCRIHDCLDGFVGEQLQVPPAFSALKYKGKPLYYYARKGINITKEPRRIHISRLDWMNVKDSLVGKDVTIVVRVVCSKGTYIRTLAADIGRELGCGAYLTGLRRTKSGVFSVDNAFPGIDLRNPEMRKLFIEKGFDVESVVNLLQ